MLPGRPPGSRTEGVILIAVLLFLLPLTILLAVTHQRVTRRISVSLDLERQLYSLNLASNGVEMVRTLLPALDLSTVSVPEAAGESRNPVTRDVALSTELERLDSMLPDLSTSELEKGRGMAAAAGEGRILVRLTNNPEEETPADRDGTVIVRSMGVTRARARAVLPGVVNCVTVVESRLRQERAFELPAAVLLFGLTGRFSWAGNRFRIRGGEAPAIAIVGTGGSALADQLAMSLQGLDEVLVSAGPKVADVTEDYENSTARARLLTGSFWAHFLKSLPGHVFESGARGLRYFADGLVLTDRLEGIVITRGPVLLYGHAEVAGLLIHLGGGPLELQEEARIVGGLWLSDPAHLTVPSPEPLDLRIGDEAEVVYDREQMERALWLFPCTQLGWRIISPEMEDD